MGAPKEAGRAPEGAAQQAEHPTMLGLSHVTRSPRWTLKAVPKPQKPPDAPGPGAYGAPSTEVTSLFQRGPRFAFGSAGREAVGKHKAPGPGSYSCTRGDIGSSSRAYSMTPRRNPDTKVKTDVPGPGAHQIKSHIGEGPKYSASSRVVEFKQNSGPGPSDYEQGDRLTLGKTPRWGFGTSQRLDAPMEKAHAATPGPGTYLLGSAVGDGPRFSMKARPMGSRGKDVSPGPGAYGGHFTQFTPR